jgi:hypothetical protein
MGNVLWVALILVLWAGSSVWALTRTCTEFVENHCDGTPVDRDTEVVPDDGQCRPDNLLEVPGSCAIAVDPGVQLRLKNIGVEFTDGLTIDGGSQELIDGSTLRATHIATSGMDRLWIRQRSVYRSTLTATSGNIDLKANDSVVLENSNLDAAGDIYIDPDAVDHKVKIERSKLETDGIIQVTALDGDILCNKSGGNGLGLTANVIDFSAENGTITTIKLCEFHVMSNSTMYAEGSLKVDRNKFVCVPGMKWEFKSDATCEVTGNDFDDCICECNCAKEKGQCLTVCQ